MTFNIKKIESGILFYSPKRNWTKFLIYQLNSLVALQLSSFSSSYTGWCALRNSRMLSCVFRKEWQFLEMFWSKTKIMHQKSQILFFAVIDFEQCLKTFSKTVVTTTGMEIFFVIEYYSYYLQLLSFQVKCLCELN